MAKDSAPDPQLDALKNKVARLEQQLLLWKKQVELEIEQARLPFAQLQGIKAGTAGVELPSGKEGTVKVSAGAAGTALLRSKRPMLNLLNDAADKLIKICKDQGKDNDTVLLTEDQLEQAGRARLTREEIDGLTSRLKKVTEAAKPKATAAPPHALAASMASAVALAHGIGFTLDTINSLAKLLRANRQLDVFDADVEAVALLSNLIESKSRNRVTRPALLGEAALDQAKQLRQELRRLGEHVHLANDVLDTLASTTANPPGSNGATPTMIEISRLKAGIEDATVLLEGLHPVKNPDAFWKQAIGQAIEEHSKGKLRLLIEVKAQTVQVTDSRWYRSDRILAIGEVQVSYRFLGADGSLLRADVMLMASRLEDVEIDQKL